MAILNQNDILFAHKALNLMPGLTEATRRVAAAIIDHFNKRDGRCDPGMERIANLLGIDRGTVIRATKKLHSLKLILKVSHGGKAHCASYSPNWAAFRSQVAEWDARMKSEACADGVTSSENAGADQVSNVAAVPPSMLQACHVEGGTGATQTLRMNQSKEPLKTEPVETDAEKSTAQSRQMPPNGLWKGRSGLGQQFHSPPVRGSRSISHDQAARAAAERRWYGWVQKLDQGVHARLIEWMTEDRREAATQAEMDRRHGGMDYIAKALQWDVMQRMTMQPMRVVGNA